MTTRNSTLTVALWAIPAIVVLGGAAFGAKMLMPAPADLDMSLTQTSADGTFTATLEPADPIVLEAAQTWIVDIDMADGTALAPADVTVDGGMPDHGHGLPTEPQVTRDLGDGRFEVTNFVFSMGGWWVVNVHVKTADGEDQATFNFTL